MEKISNYQSQLSIDNENIDFNHIFNFLLRNKRLITSISFISFIFSVIFASVAKKTWQGDFQIVLKNNTDIKSNFTPSSRRSFFANYNNLVDSLGTEVGILESPSILLPVYELVKEKKLKGSNKKEFVDFASWKKRNLLIGLEKGTSILNISYKDKEKDIILPVLNKISYIYQDYSGKNKKRSQELGKAFLVEQISIFKDKSASSLKASQEFAIKQNLNFLGLFEETINNPGFPGSDQIPSSSSGIEIEKRRVDASNKINEIDYQIKKINELDIDSQQLKYIGFAIPPLQQEGLLDLLSEYESTLIEKQLLYTNESNQIKSLNEKIDLLIKVIKNRTIGYLKSERIKTEAQMEAAIRPKETILKYYELIREAKRNESTLVNLENQLIALELEESKKEDPWELITKPTLKSNYVAPSKNFIGILGLLIGLISSISYSFYKERKSDLIFDESQFNGLFGIKIIEKISLLDYKLEINSNEIFINEIMGYTSNSQIKFILPSEISQIEFTKVLEKVFKDLFKYKVENNFIKLNDEDKIIFIVQIGTSKIKDIRKILSRLKSLNKKILGVIFIKDGLLN